MTKDPKCCVATDVAQHAATIMRDEDTGFVPVVESHERRKLIGVVTDRDLCMGVVAQGKDPRSAPVADCMTPKVVTCAPDDSVDRASELMRENQIRRVPIVNDQGELVGIVAMADIVERDAVKPAQTHETLKKVSEPTEAPSKPRAQSKNAA
jgi:CBS domain-containing protein